MMNAFGTVIVPTFIAVFIAVSSLNIGGFYKRGSPTSSEDKSLSAHSEVVIVRFGNRGFNLGESIRESHSAACQNKHEFFLVYLGPGESVSGDRVHILADRQVLQQTLSQVGRKPYSGKWIKIDRDRVAFDEVSGRVRVIIPTIPRLSRYALAIN
jgi:hypothetical protein